MIEDKALKVLFGETPIDEFSGSTAEMLMVGLALDALDKTNPEYTADKKLAQQLDPFQR